MVLSQPIPEILMTFPKISVHPYCYMIKKNVMTKPPEQLFPEQELCQQGERINI